MPDDINDPFNPNTLESLRCRVLAACDIAPPITFSVDELARLVAILESIVEARRENIPHNVFHFPRRRRKQR